MAEYFVCEKINSKQIDTKTNLLINKIISNEPTDLINYDILDNISMKRTHNMMSKIKPKSKKMRAFGCFMGMVIGDAFGASLEFKPIDYEPHPSTIQTEMTSSVKFGLKAGQYTDDASMGLCLADSLIMCEKFDPHDLMLRFIAWWYCGYNNAFKYDYENKTKQSVGLGGNISHSFTTFIETGINYTTYGNNNTSGNGSIMRNAAIPIAYLSDPLKAIKIAHLQSKCTHKGQEAANCASLLTWICINWINEPTLHIDEIMQTFLNTIQSNIGSVDDYLHPNIISLIRSNSKSDWNWKAKHYKYNIERTNAQPEYIGSYSTDCLAMALHFVYYTTNFADAIIKATNIGGDADSVGSVVGQLAGSKYGYDSIPLSWKQSVLYWNDTVLYKIHLLYGKKYK